MTSPPFDLRASLRESVLDASWGLLAPHHARDALFVVRPDVDLLDVATALAVDDVARVQGWVARGALGRPDAALIARWEQQGALFHAVIVQPWVVAVERDPSQLDDEALADVDDG